MLYGLFSLSCKPLTVGFDMLAEKELKKICSRLFRDDVATFSLEGNDITIRIFEDASKLSLATQVYLGGNFIPNSVRKCILQKPFLEYGSMRTFLSVDERHFRIILHYLGGSEDVNKEKLKNLLEEFGYLAEAWRLFLDEHDKHDLVHVRVK